MKNNKGFTLVELLVAVAILGIITGMSVPMIRNIQLNNEQKKYKTYGTAMISSAHLYRDSYDEDLFGHKASGCALVTLDQLIQKGLIKDYSDNHHTSCNYDESMVRIVKVNKQYGYSYQLYCGTNASNSIEVASSLTRKEKILTDYAKEYRTPLDNDISFGGFDMSACNYHNSMTIEANPSMRVEKDSSAYNYKVKVSLVSSTGIRNSDIQYSWISADAVSHDESSSNKVHVYFFSQEDSSSCEDVREWFHSIEGEYGEHFDFIEYDVSQYEDNAELMKKVANSRGETVHSYPYIVIGNRSWQDINDTSKAEIIQKIESEFVIDSSLREDAINSISPESNITIDYNSITNWNNLRFHTRPIEEQQNKILAGEQITYTSSAIAPPSDTANSYYLVLKINDYSDLSLEPYANKNEYFGEYNVAVKYGITYDDNGGSGCSSENKSVYHFKDGSEKWGSLCQPERDNYKFKEWNTKADGSGIKVTEDMVATSDLKVYAQWEKDEVVFRFLLEDGETIMNSTTSNTGTRYWGKSDDGFVTYSSSASGAKTVYKHTIAKGTDVVLDLPNYNNSEYIHISNEGMTAKSNAEWKCVSGCKNANQTFKHSKYNSFDTNTICDSSTNSGTCDVVLKVNWEAIPNIYQITLDQRGGTGGTSTLYEKYNAGWYSNATGTQSIATILKPTKTGYKFSGYYTGTNGSGDQIINENGSIVATNKKFTSNSKIYAHWTPNVLTIRFKVNSGETLNTKNGQGFTVNGNFIYKNGNLYTVKVNYGSTLATGGLPNWHNSSFIYINKKDYNAVDDKQWINKSTNETFDHATQYRAQAMCSTLKNGDCTIDLSVNWRVAYAKIKYHANGGSVSKKYSQPYISLVNGYVAKNGNIKIERIGAKANIKNGGWGLIDVKNTNYCYLVRTGYKVDHNGGNTWNTKANGKGKTYNQYKKNYLGGDFCDTSNGDCSVVLYVKWIKK